MTSGITLIDSPNSLIENCSFWGYDIGVDLVDTKAVTINGLQSVPRYHSSDHLKLYGSKVGRNHLCPCGSGVKVKKCKGVSSMSTGIRSDNSTFTVGKATIVAETGVDLKNNSKAHIDELNFYSTDTPEALVKILMSLPVQPPHDLVVDAMEQQKAVGNIEGSKLWDWFQKQGINLAFWPQIAVGIASLIQ